MDVVSGCLPQEEHDVTSGAVQSKSAMTFPQGQFHRLVLSWSEAGFLCGAGETVWNGVVEWMDNPTGIVQEAHRTDGSPSNVDPTDPRLVCQDLACCCLVMPTPLVGFGCKFVFKGRS